MAKKLPPFRSFGLIIGLLLLLGIVLSALAIQQSTDYQQHASQFEDLNAAQDITYTNNTDGTMGPVTWEGNFSNTLPSAYLGSLNFQVTDPVQGRRPTDIPIVTLIPTRQVPTQTQNEGSDRPSVTPEKNSNQDGPQAVSSLVITVTKVEVHLARLGLPGSHNEMMQPSETHGRPSITPGRPSVSHGAEKDNQHVDKWETLNINAPQVVDLVQLAKNHSFASLGITKLANGMYTEVRLYISQATAIFSDGTKVTLTIPGKANTVRVVEPFIIDSAKTTTLTMDFDAQNSVIKSGGLYLLKPVVAHFNQQNQQ